MKNLSKAILIAASFFSILFTSTAFADGTGSYVVGRVQVTDTGNAYFRAKAPNGFMRWGGDVCDATYAYILPDAIGYHTIVSMAVASQLNDIPMRFYGECRADGNYILISYAFLN